MEKQQFIDIVKDGAIQGMKQYGILASLTIAQAIVESGWGESGLTKQANSLFGIKVSSDWTGDKITLPTVEYYNGVRTIIEADFRKYASLNDSILDHANFLVKNSRYHNLLGITDYKAACSLISQDGYATDPNYTSILIDIIEENNLQQYDNDQIITPGPETVDKFILTIQRQLNTLLKEGLVEDGILGTITLQAIKDFQSIMGLVSDGIWGPKTVGAVTEILNRPTDGVPYPHYEYATRYIQWRVGAGVDGTFGNQTKVKVQSWQANHTLDPDGVVGAATWSRLLDENV